MANNLKVFDTIQEYENAVIENNSVSYVKEDNSIRYSGGVEHSVHAPVAAVKINGTPISADTDGNIDIGNVQEQLVSGDNIKTINNQSILGRGNIEIVGGNTDVDLSAYATKLDLNNKVDKVSGKQLSTEDFTTALKNKLSGLSNYDDTAINSAISSLQTQLNTLVSGDASTAIESFNEIIAFLDGVQDTQDLSSIISSIEQQIASKQDKINDLETIRSGAAKGATALQSYTEKYTGTITGIKMNGASKGTSGVVDLGTVITSHQDISGKADKSSLAAVATSGSYNDLSNKPTIPAEQVNADWNATSGKAQILNKPTIPAAVTEATVSGWGFTKNAGTVTGVKINGSTKSPSSGIVDLGTVITSHQDISGKQDNLVSGNNIKTINGESILGSGDIEIGGSSIVIFNPGGDPAEEYAKLVDAHNNNRIVYFGMPNDDGTFTPSLPVQFTIYNETDPIYVNVININGGSAISLAGGVFIVSPTEISIGENSYIEFITDDEGLFLSGDGTYRRPSSYINLNSEIPQIERNAIETAIRNGFSCFALLYENYVPCHIVADISDPESDYKVYTFTSNDTGGLTLTEWTITLESITATNTTDFNLNNYALKSETGVAYAEYTGTSAAVAVTTKYGYFPTTLVEGARVSVKFEGSLTSVSTLNVNGTGAKNVYYKGNSLTSGMINRYNTYDFVYDGSYWRIIGVNTDSDTHYTAKNIVGASATAKSNATAANGNVYLNLIENSAVRSSHNIKGEGSVTVTSDTSGNIIISGSSSGGGSSDANVQAVDTTETIDDVNEVPNVKYVAQTLTDAQKTQARTNIGAASSTMVDEMNDLLESVNTDLADLTSNKQDALVSGTNIKTVNNTTLLGSGNLSVGTITGVSANGTSVATSGVANIPAASTSKYGVTKLSSSTSSTSTTLAATASAVKAAYDLANGKQAALVSGTNIKTINGQSLLGSGNITIEGGSSGDSSNSEQGIIKPTGESEPIISPGVYNIVNIETFQWLCIIKLDNIPSSSEISSGIVREWKLIIKYFDDTPISFDDSICWANDNVPEFEVGRTYEFSFIASLGVDGSVKILGIWSKFDTRNSASSGTDPL